MTAKNYMYYMYQLLSKLEPNSVNNRLLYTNATIIERWVVLIGTDLYTHSIGNL